jgi:hypothetical protein
VLAGSLRSRNRFPWLSLAFNRCVLQSRQIAKQPAQAVRSRWGIENSLHWFLDFTFREDECRTRKGHGAQNIAALRRLAITPLKREPTKQSLTTKRLIAGWDDDYLFRVLLAAGGG